MAQLLAHNIMASFTLFLLLRAEDAFAMLAHTREVQVNKCKHVVCMCEFREGGQELSLKDKG